MKFKLFAQCQANTFVFAFNYAPDCFSNEVMYDRLKHIIKEHLGLVFLASYSFLSIMMLFYLMAIFYANGKGLGWSIDSLPIQFPMFSYLRDSVREVCDSLICGDMPLIYDFRMGMGGDTLTTLSVWYFEPLSFLAAFVPVNMLESLYDLLILTRIYLMGISFWLLCLYMKKQNIYSILIGALIYAFSGWTYFYIRHPVFFAAPIYYPVMIISLKEVLKGKRGILFIIMTALSAWTHYYFLYVNSILLFFVVVAEIVTDRRDGIKGCLVKMGRILWRYLLGISLAMIVLLPNILTFLNSNRTTPHLETGSFWRFEAGWFLRLITGLITPFFSAGHWLHNGFISIGLISLVLVIVSKRNVKIRIWTLLIAAGLVIPAVTFVFTGFSAIQFRWNYAIGLLLAYSVVEYWEKHTEIKKEIIGILLILAVYIAIPVFNKDMDHKYHMVSIVFMSLYIFLILVFMGRKTNRIFYALLSAVVMINIVVDINYTFLPEHGNYMEEFVPRGKSIEIITNEPEAASYAIEDDSFFRIDSARLKVENENSAVFLNNHGISNYVNVMDRHIADYYHGLENVNTRLLDTIDHDSRTILEELSSVKYFFVNEEDTAYVPYGYDLLKSVDGVDIYLNRYALPLGYSYTEILPREEYDALSALERQEALMKAVVLEDDVPLETYRYESSVAQDENISFTFHGCEYDQESGVCRVIEPGGYFTVRYSKTDDAETYLRLGGLDIDAYYDAYWKIRIYNGSVDKEVELRSASATYSYGNYDYLINLGYYNSESEVSIAFPFVCEVRLDSVEVLHQPMKNYESDCAERQKEVLENVYIGNNLVGGDFKATQDEVCVLSIPYSRGWKAYVDGNEQEILKANVTFMGLLLEPGEHHIELKYCTPGLIPGAVISACGIIILIIYLILYKRCQQGAIVGGFAEIRDSETSRDWKNRRKGGERGKDRKRIENRLT